MSFLRLRLQPLDPDTSEDANGGEYRTSVPAIPLPLALSNRSKSEDPPGSILIANRNRVETYETTEEDEDDGSSSLEFNMTSSSSLATERVNCFDESGNRIDPPLVNITTTHHPIVSSSSLVTGNAFHDRKPEEAPLVLHKQPQLDRNLNVRRGDTGRGSRSPEVTLVEQYTVSNGGTPTQDRPTYSQSQINPDAPSYQSHSSSVLQPEAPLPKYEPNNGSAFSKSVQFSNVHVHETVVLDHSYISNESGSFLSLSKSSKRQSDPPSMISEAVRTVDEYEAQRQPQRRRYKQEGKSPGTKANIGNRRDELRRILSSGTASSLIIPSNKPTTSLRDSQSNISEYIHIQELAPKQSHGSGRNGGPSLDVGLNKPISQNADDIFQEYQRSFIQVEDEQEQTNNATRTQRGLWSSNSRSAPTSQQRQQQQPSKSSFGLLRRFFPKKDSDLKTIL